MKRIVLTCITILFVAIAYAQTPNKPVPKKESLPTKKSIKYCCIKGNYSDLKPGQCPIDDSTLVQEGTYYCEVCDSTSNKPAKCKGCEHDMIKIQCPVTAVKEGKKR